MATDWLSSKIGTTPTKTQNLSTTPTQGDWLSGKTGGATSYRPNQLTSDIQPSTTTVTEQPKSLFKQISSVLSSKFNQYTGGTEAIKARIEKESPVELTKRYFAPAAQYVKDTAKIIAETAKGAGRLTVPYLISRAVQGKPVTAKEYSQDFVNFGLNLLNSAWRVSPATAPTAAVFGSATNTIVNLRRLAQGNATWEDLANAPTTGLTEQPGFGEVFTDNIKTARAIDIAFMAMMITRPFVNRAVNKLNLSAEEINQASKILGTKPGAKLSEVEKAFKSEMKKLPDTFTDNPIPANIARRTELTSAYNILKKAGVIDKKWASAYDFLSGKAEQVGVEIPKTKTPEAKQLLAKNPTVEVSPKTVEVTKITQGDYEPQQIIDKVVGSPLQNTAEGKQLISQALSAQKSGARITIKFNPNEMQAYKYGAEKPATSYTKTEEVKYPEGEVAIDYDKSLQGRESEAQVKAGEYIEKNLPKAVEDYNKRVMEEFGSNNVVSGDEAKYVIPGFDASMSRAYHEPASALSKVVAKDILKRAEGDGRPAMFMAGGSGSGKTSVIKKYDQLDRYAVVYDANLNNFDSAVKKIDPLLKDGREIVIDFVYRPISPAFEGVIRRTSTRGRIVPIKQHLDTHIGAIETITKLKEKYGDKINISVFDNSGQSLADVKLSDLQTLQKVQYNRNLEETKLYDRIKEALDKGEISRSQYETFIESRPEGASGSDVAGIQESGERSGIAKQAASIVESKTREEIRAKLEDIFGKDSELDAIDKKVSNGESITEVESKKLDIADEYMADMETAAIERNYSEVEDILKMVKSQQKTNKEELKNSIEKYNQDLREYYNKAGEANPEVVGQAWYEVMSELDVAAPGQRLFDEYGEFQGSLSSTFPDWVPEELRSSKLFDGVVDGIRNPLDMSYPPNSQPRKQALYDAILDEIDSRAELDSQSIRQNIRSLYEESRPKPKPQEVVRGSAQGAEGATGQEVAPTKEVTRPVGGETPSKIGKSIEQKAIEQGIASRFDQVAGYDKITIKDQAEKAAELMKDMDKTSRVVRGEEPLPEGLRGSALITALEEYVKKTGDGIMAYDLANSPLVSETSAAAQELRLVAEREPDSMAKQIMDLKKAREKAVKEKTGKTAKEAVKEETGKIKKEVKKVDKYDWKNFIDSIEC